jgi:Tfp pilus assembly protein PilN
MRAVHLDFLRPSPPQTWLGVALLVAGAVAAGAVVYQWRTAAAEVDRLETRATDFKRMARREAPRIAYTGDAKQLAAEIRSANTVIAQMTLPWDTLFRELEAAAVQDVALLSIQPDADTRKLRLTGEARKYPDVLAYVASLEERPALANVFLIGHEMKQTVPQRPVAFSLVAEWSAADLREPPAAQDDAAKADGAKGDDAKKEGDEAPRN